MGKKRCNQGMDHDGIDLKILRYKQIIHQLEMKLQTQKKRRGELHRKMDLIRGRHAAQMAVVREGYERRLDQFSPTTTEVKLAEQVVEMADENSALRRKVWDLEGMMSDKENLAEVSNA